MTILLIGLNHKTAPIALREQLALSDCGLRMVLNDFQSIYIEENNGIKSPLRELFVLSTCNRFELYVTATGEGDEAQQRGWHAAINFLLSLQNIDREELVPHLYLHADEEAIEHLLRVSSGLDSMILGEPQILGQLGRAYHDAHAAGTTGPILSYLSAQAIRTGKRVRTETAIARHTTSVSHAALGLAKELLGDLNRCHGLIVGAGDMAKLAAHAAQIHKTGTISVINRTFASADALARTVDGQAAVWGDLPQMLGQVDFVLSATGAPHTVIHREDVAHALANRAARPLAILDVAVPRDVELAVADLPNVTYCDVDALQGAVDGNIAQRRAEVPHAEEIIAAEATQVGEWLSQRKVVPVITDLRAQAKAIAAQEVAEAKQRLRKIDTHAFEIAEETVERLAHRLVNKLLHIPTIQLKEHAAGDDGHDYAHMLRELFALAQSSKPTTTTGSELFDGELGDFFDEPPSTGTPELLATACNSLHLAEPIPHA